MLATLWCDIVPGVGDPCEDKPPKVRGISRIGLPLQPSDARCDLHLIGISVEGNVLRLPYPADVGRCQVRHLIIPAKELTGAA